MNERHPVDDLFARALRNAEARPPQAVWNGILEQRGARRRFLLLLRRRGGLLGLILLCGGIGTYGVLSLGAEGGETSGPMQAHTIASSPLALIGTYTPAGEMTADIGTSDPGRQEPLENTARRSGSVSWEKTSSVNKAAASLLLTQTEHSKTSAVHGGLDSRTTSATGSHEAVSSIWPSHSNSGNSPSSNLVPVLASAETETTVPLMDLAHVSVERLPFRSALADRSSAVSAPIGSSAPPLFPDHIRWWVGSEVGSYAETRKWHGGDLELAEALNGTERLHPLWGVGISGGWVSRKGWGLSSGIIYCVGRSEFRHLDHVLAPMDSLVPYVITFNNEVIASYTETVSVLAPAQEEVAVENRYYSLRIPVEASWQHSIRRWKYRAVIAPAVEFNTLRSGATLEHRDDGSGLSTVDVEATNMKRTTILMTGSVALDIGYALTEDWQLWAGPSYAAGLFPLSHNDYYPYAMPERPGFHARLCYMLRSHE